MKKLYLILAVLLAMVALSMPVSAYISVKYIPDFTPVRSAEMVAAPPPGGYSDVWMYQYPTVGWDVNVQRLPSGPVDTYDDSALAAGLWTQRLANRDFAIWTDYPVAPGFPFYWEEDGTFSTMAGYDTYVTIVPQIIKFVGVPVVPV